jgi:hypothetical protein
MRRFDAIAAVKCDQGRKAAIRRSSEYGPKSDDFIRNCA